MTRIAVITALAVLSLGAARGAEEHRLYFECGAQWVTVSWGDDPRSYNVTFWKITGKTPRFEVGEGNVGRSDGKRCRRATEDEFNCATAESRFAAQAFCRDGR
jgi:hypothetical protein